MTRALAVLIAVAAVLAAGASARSSGPRLVITATNPLSVRGAHFAPAERIRVTGFVKGATATRSVVATASGTFTVRFRTLDLSGCGIYGARATGSAGSKVTVRIAPECAPGPTSP